MDFGAKDFSAGNNMTPEELDQGYLGFVNDLEPALPPKKRKNVKIKVHPETGEPVYEKIKAPKQLKGNKLRGQVKQKR